MMDVWYGGGHAYGKLRFFMHYSNFSCCDGLIFHVPGDCFADLAFFLVVLDSMK